MTNLDYTPDNLATLDWTPAELAIDVDTADLLFRDARTAQTFTDEPVGGEQLRAIYDLVKWAPTSMNIQPLRIALIASPQARERLLGHMASGNRARTVAAPMVVVLAADVDFHEELPRVMPVNPNARSLFADESRREGAAQLNTALQMGYFIIGVRAAGLAAGPMGGFDADGVSREFFPDGRHRALLVVNIGHPAEGSYRPRQPRLDYEDVVTTW